MRGVTVTLHVRTQKVVDSTPVYDALNNPVYVDSVVTVDNVLIGEPSTDEVTSSINFEGKRLAYVLGIPKGDTHNWTNTEVEFFGQRFRTFGATVQGIETLVPTPWHKKVWVERYE
jgi:hypothetical protein